MGSAWWELQYKKITSLDASLLTVGVPNETVLLKEDGNEVRKPKGDIVARKRAQMASRLRSKDAEGAAKK